MTYTTPSGAILLNIEDAAHLTGYSVSHLYVLVRQGKVPARKVGRSVRFTAAELEAWAAALPAAGS